MAAPYNTVIKSFNEDGVTALRAVDLNNALADVNSSLIPLSRLDAAALTNGTLLGVVSGGVGAATLPVATTGANGMVRPDGSTITITNGIISASGATGGGGAGTITGITAGSGLTGGGTSGAVTLTVTFASTVPLADGTAAAGTSLVAARADHVHPTDTTLVRKVDVSATAAQLLGGTGTAGTAAAITVGSGLLLSGGALTATATGGGGTGTVNTGTTGQLAAYLTGGTAVSGIAIGSGLALSSGTLTAVASGIIAPRIVTAAGGVTVSASDGMVVIKKTTGAATTVTLEATPTPGVIHQIKDGKGDALTNPITIVPSTGTIDGEVNFILNQAYDSVTLQYNGTEWSVT